MKFQNISKELKREFMQWGKNKWILIIAFFLGVLVCFIATRFYYFEIKKELDVPNLIMGILGLTVGIYIADNLQKKNNQNQNKYSFLESKLDKCWMKFSSLAKVISIDDKVGLETLSKFNHDIIHELVLIKNAFIGSELECVCLEALELKLESFEEFFDELETSENIKYYREQKSEVENKIVEINKCFSEVLKFIQNIG